MPLEQLLDDQVWTLGNTIPFALTPGSAAAPCFPSSFPKPYPTHSCLPSSPLIQLYFATQKQISRTKICNNEARVHYDTEDVFKRNHSGFCTSNDEVE